MKWEQLQAAIKEAKEAGDAAKVEKLLTDYAISQNGKVEGLNGEAAKYRKTASERGDLLAKYGDIDPEKYHQMQTDAATAKENKLKAAGQFDEIRAKDKKDFDAALEASNTAGLGWKSKFEGLSIKQPVIEAGVAMNAVAPNEVAQLLSGRVKMNDEGVAVVYDATGNAAFNKEGKPETIKGLVEGFLQANPHHVKGTGGGSGGHNNSDGTDTGKVQINAGQIGDNLEAVAKGDAVVQQ